LPLPGVILLPILVRLLTFSFQRDPLSNNSQALCSDVFGLLKA
jgi:hypothetical protein